MEAYKFIYKPITLRNYNISSDMFEEKIKHFIKTKNLIPRAIALVDDFKDESKSFIKNQKHNKLFKGLNSFDEKVVEYIGQIYLLTYEDTEPNKHDLNEIFISIIHKSRLFDICVCIEKGKYKGYYDYINNFNNNNN